MCSSTSTPAVHPSGESVERVLSHISVEYRQRPASLDGNAKHKQASSKGTRLESTLLDQAIEMECRLRQWGKALEEEALEEMTGELENSRGWFLVKFLE